MQNANKININVYDKPLVLFLVIFMNLIHIMLSQLSPKLRINKENPQISNLVNKFFRYPYS